MKTISTGQPSTVGTYHGISKFFGEAAEDFMAEYERKFGPDEEVIAEESQMLYLLANISQMSEEAVVGLKKDFFGDKDDLFTI